MEELQAEGHIEELVGPVQPPTPIRKRWWFWLGTLVGLSVITLGIVAAVGSGDGLPDQVAGLDRLHTERVQALEDDVDQARNGLDVETAVYGTDADEVLMLFRYADLPDSPTLSLLLRGAGHGIVVSGGEADFNAEVLVTRDGVEYDCMPFTGRLLPGDMIDAKGQMCAWTEGEEYLLLIDARGEDIAQAVADAAAVHKALDSS